MADYNNFDPLAWASQNNASVNNNEPQPNTSAPVVNPAASLPPDGELAKARATVEELLRLGANIADSYQDWWDCGCALAELGPEARDLFHQVSSQSAKYREGACEKKWQECLAKRDGRITIATFYDMAKRAGADLSAISRQFPSTDKTSKPLKPRGSAENGNQQTGKGVVDSQSSNNQSVNTQKRIFDAPRAKTEHSGEENEVLRFSFSRTFSQQLDITKLPVTIQRTLEGQHSAEERDKTILADLDLLAIVQPNVYGIYGEKRVYTPFYLFVLGPAGISHKGTIDDIKHLLTPIVRSMQKQYYAQLAEYKEQHAEWEARKVQRKRGDTSAEPEPEEPTFRSLFISADSSAAAFKQDLYNFGGRGIVFSTEADTLTQVLTQEWGQFTDTLRLAFHHEDITSTRTKDKQHIIIEEPQLGLLVTCTPDQVVELLSPKQNENGTSSRDLFYCTRGNMEWCDPFASKEPAADRYREIGESVKQMYDLLIRRNNSRIQILLTDEQKQAFNEHFKPLLPEQIGLYGVEFAAFIVRIALVAFRMMMVLSTLRNFEHGRIADPQQQAFVCSDDDYHTAMIIIDCLLAHTAYVYNTLLRPGDDNQLSIQPMKPREQQLLLTLPGEFTTKQFEQTAKTLNIPLKTAQRYLGCLISRYQLIERTSHGHYAKVGQKAM